MNKKHFLATQNAKRELSCMVETGGKSNLSWCALRPALEPPKKSGLLPEFKTGQGKTGVASKGFSRLTHS